MLLKGASVPALSSGKPLRQWVAADFFAKIALLK
jgi:hypothetical protein